MWVTVERIMKFHSFHGLCEPTMCLGSENEGGEK